MDYYWDRSKCYINVIRHTNPRIINTIPISFSTKILEWKQLYNRLKSDEIFIPLNENNNSFTVTTVCLSLITVSDFKCLHFVKKEKFYLQTGWSGVFYVKVIEKKGVSWICKGDSQQLCYYIYPRQQIMSPAAIVEKMIFYS